MRTRAKSPGRFGLRAVLFAAVLTIAAPTVAAAQAEKPAPKTDLTGKWQFTVNTENGTGTPTVTLKQVGDTLTGRYSSQVLGEADLKGTVKDGKIDFTFRAEVQGTALVVTYTGTVVSNDSLKGSLSLGELGSGTFTAKRQ